MEPKQEKEITKEELKELIQEEQGEIIVWINMEGSQF